ncbi:hypothetical protein [Bacillus cereus]|uniref:hypothetical protein n=1 Tax=Bacillus cereus TaxID=1396 RepID=UPI00382B4A12
MKVISGKVEQDLVLKEDLRVEGMVVGNVAVETGKTLIVNGMIVGNLHIKEESFVEIHGNVNGDVLNEGGELKVYGTINGRLFRERGRTIVDTKATVSEM